MNYFVEGLDFLIILRMQREMVFRVNFECERKIQDYRNQYKNEFFEMVDQYEKRLEDFD